jgi:hypothetical protein
VTGPCLGGVGKKGVFDIWHGASLKAAPGRHGSPCRWSVNPSVLTGP